MHFSLTRFPSSARTFFILALFLQAGLAHAATNLKIGPTLTFGFPHIVNIHVDAKHWNYFSEGIGGGYIGATIRNNIKFSITNYEGRLRWHPFAGSFIVGLAGGSQKVHAETHQVFNASGTSVPTTVKADLNGAYLSPHLGWFWIFNSGFTLGFEVGVQAPIGAKSTLAISIDDPSQNAYLDQVKATPEYQQAEQDLEDAGNQIGKLVLPYVTVLRLGWMF